jgi:hypothetical protein
MEQAARQIIELAVRHYQNHGPAFPAWTGPHPDAILQPPKPEIQPLPRILEHAADRDPDMEAAD